MTATEQGSNTVSSIDDLDIVADCDFHLTETQEDFLPYIQEPWTELLSRQLEDVHDGKFLKPLYPNSGILNLGRTTGRIPPRKCNTPEDVREGMDELGVTNPILTAGLNLSLGTVHHDELASALATAYNDWWADTFADEGLHGAAVIAPQQPRKAADEIDDRAGQKGIVAALFPTGGVFPPLGHEMYHPIYEACERAGLPLMMHGTANGIWRNFPMQHQGLPRHLSAHYVAHQFNHQTNIVSMIANGIPELYPDLDFVIQEAGIGYIPYLMNRLDHEYPGNVEDAPLLEMAPSEYIHRQFYFTSQPLEGTHNPEYVRSIVKLFDGGQNLMLSSDYPHYDFDDTNQLLQILRPAFTDEELRNIYGETARRVYGL